MGNVVSILILLDVISEEDRGSFHVAGTNGVSILILLDVISEAPSADIYSPAYMVSILILLDVISEDSED